MRITGKDTENELDGLDEWELKSLAGEISYDPSDPSDWPEELKAAARRHWRSGPEAFDRWAAS